MNSAGQPQRDVIISKLVDRHGFEKEAITKIVDTCLKEKDSDNCETAYKIFQCYRSNRTVKDKFNSYKPSSPAAGSSTPSSLVTKNSSPGTSSSLLTSLVTKATPVLAGSSTPSSLIPKNN